MSNNWFNIPDESTLTESNICEFCAADKEECGEYAECCYRGLVEKYCSSGLTPDSKEDNIFGMPCIREDGMILPYGKVKL